MGIWGASKPGTDPAVRIVGVSMGLPAPRAQPFGALRRPQGRSAGRISRTLQQLFVADIGQCHVLAGPVGSLLLPLRALVSSMDLRQRLPQIEVTVVRADAQVRTVLVVRILDPLSESDRASLERFATAHQVSIWIQPRGPDTAVPLTASDQVELALQLPEFGLQLPFAPTDFTQVNHAVNEVLVRRSLALLDVRAGERALDLFCGLGNFTLPLATRVAQVIGIEGNQAQVARAAAAAEANGLQSKVRFLAQDLSGWTSDSWEALNQREGRIDLVLADPPREGALAVARALAASPVRPRRLVYVSCNPATLARDCAVLVHRGPLAPGSGRYRQHVSAHVARRIAGAAAAGIRLGCRVGSSANLRLRSATRERRADSGWNRPRVTLALRIASVTSSFY